jgi:hypothetical protein
VKIIEEFEKLQKTIAASNAATFLSIHRSKRLFKRADRMGDPAKSIQ